MEATTLNRGVTTGVMFRIFAVHALIWTLVPTLVNRNLPLDTIEALAWGHEWELGYDKHPPMSAWILEAAAMLGQHRDWAVYLLSQVFVGVTLLLTYQLARQWLSVKQSVVATLVLEGIIFFSYTTPEFNVNVTQMPFWVGGFLAYWRAIETRKIGWWMVMGFCVAMSVLSKYLGGLMLLPMVSYALWHPQRRKIWSSPGPYVAALFCTLLLLPHLIWMIRTDFATLSYGLRRADLAVKVQDSRWIKHLFEPLQYLAEQLAVIATAIILHMLTRPQRRGYRVQSETANLNTQSREEPSREEPSREEPSREEPSREARMFINMMALGPLLFLLIFSALMAAEIRTMWTTPMLSLLGIFLAFHFPSTLPTLRVEQQFVAGVIATLIAISTTYAVSNLLARNNRATDRRTAYPGDQIADELTEKWQQQFGRPLKVVIGEEWLGGNVCWYSEDQPTLYHSADRSLSPWVNDDIVRRDGALVIWRQPTLGKNRELSGDVFSLTLQERFENIIQLPPIELNWSRSKKPTHYTIHVAFIPPAPSDAP